MILVGDLVAEFLQRCGVTTAFGVVSVHNIPMLDAVGRGNAIRFVMARGEAGAGHMADAYARVNGALGVLVTSTGPGAANAAGALVEARFAGSPVLHLTGQTATGNIDRGQGPVHDVPDQLGMLKSVSKAAFRVRSAETVLGTLMQAASLALTPPTGPVSVEIPIDIQRQKVPRPAAFEHFALPLPPALPADDGQLDALAALVAAARRPMLWLGNGARHAGAPAKRLLDLGFGMVTSWAGRGTVPEDHPMSLGALNGNGVPQVERFYDTVDLMIVVGSRLRGHETRDLDMRLPKRLVQIDVDPLANGRTYPSELFLCADGALALQGLADRLVGRMKVDPSFAPGLRALKSEATDGFNAGLAPYDGFAGQLRAAMPRDAIWVRDVTLANSTWGNRTFPLYGPRDSVYPVGAAIGPGLAFGIGAAVAANGRKVVSLCGDGGFALSMTELWTAAQEKLDLTIIVMNDRGYGVIKHIQDTLYGSRHFFGDLQSPDLEGLAKLAGMPFWRVSQAQNFGQTVQQALQRPGPKLVEVDMHAIGPYPRYFQPPPYAARN